MNKQKRLLQIFLAALLLLPIWSWCAWFFQPEKKLDVIIIDKSVNVLSRQEHLAFTWVMNACGIKKGTSGAYRSEVDYLGFFPLSSNPTDYKIRDLEGKTPAEVDQLADRTDFVYLADTYGIYTKQWQFKDKRQPLSSIVYGGLTNNEMNLLERMKQKRKTIVAEFNTIGPPTTDSVRSRFESCFGIKWSGWAGRYFDLLDTAQNRELPHWVVALYTQQNKGDWPFKKSGIVFVHKDGRLLILENKLHLTVEVPFVHTFSNRQSEFQHGDSIHYPFWFDVVNTSTSNSIVSYYSLSTTALGDSLLKANGLSKKFPAVIEHQGAYRFYYLAGDYANCPISKIGSYLKGIENYSYFLYNESYSERVKFFWNFYRPLMVSILSKQTTNYPLK